MGRASKWAEDLSDELKQQGFKVTRTADSHYKVVPKEKNQQIIHYSNSSDMHAQLNTVAALKKIGFNWPVPSKKEQKLETKTDLAVARDLVAGIVETPLGDEEEPVEEAFNKLFTHRGEHKGEAMAEMAAAHGLTLVTVSVEQPASASSSVPEAPVSSTQVTEREEPIEVAMDRLFAEFKSARVLVELTK